MLLLGGLLTAYFVLLPVGYLIVKSVTHQGTISFSGFSKHLLQDKLVLRSVANSLILCIGVAVVSVVIGVPLAFGVSRTGMAFKGLVRSTIIMAIITPPFLRTMAYIVLMGPNAGYINVWLRSWFFPLLTRGPLDIFGPVGLIFLCSPGGIAYVFISTSTALSQMDPSLEEVARICGAGRWKTVFRVTFQVTRNAILAGAILAFTSSLALYGTPHLLGMDVITTLIREALLMPMNLSRAAVLSTFVVIIALLVLALYRLNIRQFSRFQTVTGKGFRPGLMEIGRFRHFFTALGIAYSVLTFILPYSTLVVVSLTPSIGNAVSLSSFTLRYYRSVFTDSFCLGAIKNSLVLSVATATICLCLALLTSYVIVRTRIRGRVFLDYVSILPLGIAGIALAVGVVFVYTTPPLGRLGIYGTLWILLVAYIARFIPLANRNVQTSLMQISGELEEASRVGGANWSQTMSRITVPLIKAGMAYTWVLVFLGALPELSTSVILRHIGTNTVATAILDAWAGSGGFQKACALGSVTFLMVTLVFYLVQRLTGRSIFESEADGGSRI